MSDSQYDRSQDLFREQAREHYRSRIGTRIESVPTPPAWLRWAFGLLMLTALGGLVLLCIVRIDEYAEGTAIVRSGEASRGRIPPLLLVLPDRPEIRLDPGSPAYFRLDVYPDAEFEATVARLLPRTSGDAGPGESPDRSTTGTVSSRDAAILAEATVTDDRFRSDQPPYRLRDGMQGLVRVRTGEVPVIVYLVPGLRNYQESRANDHSR